jgi:DNA-directed RNA polymerase specialized sigma24 family protein
MLAQFQDDSSVYAAIAILSPLRQQVIKLAFFERQTHEPIARGLAIPLGTVKSHVKRTLRAMRIQIAQQRGK